MKSLDPELAERVKELRVNLGLNQIEFAELLKVTRTQVGEWERGTKEKPSVEKILEMASSALTVGDRMWFWEKAGVNLDLIKADFREELRTREGRRDPNKTIHVPIRRHLARDRHGNLEYTADGSVALPSDLVSHPGSLVCFATERRRPWIAQDGDLVFVDQSLTQPHELWNKLTAIFFAALPTNYEVLLRTVPMPLGFTSWQRPEFIDPKKQVSYKATADRLYPTREFNSDAEKRYIQAIEEAGGPDLLVGWLHIIQAGGDIDIDLDASDAPPWRLGLRVHSPLSSYCPRIALSDWQFTRMPDPEYLTIAHGPLIAGVEILGQVVGWFGKGSSEKEYRGANADE
jgi:transcriptional regulator with XRE-family HTH domain